jgi:outer membrane protein
MKKFVLCLLLAPNFISVLHATDLMEIYRQSLENDPTFKGAYSTLMSNNEALPQARASLLPQLTLSGSLSANDTNVSSSIFSIKENYQSQTWRLTATQAIFNYKAWSEVQQAKATVKAAYATFNDAAQDLMLRTANAYFDVLNAQDSLRFSTMKKSANKRQLDQATQRFNVGLDAITSVYDAQSAFDQSVAEVISAGNRVKNQKENLRKLTNHTYDELAPLRNRNIPLISPEPNNREEWVATGVKQNYKLLTEKFNVQAARENINANNAGNWPVFSLQGNTNDVRNINTSGTFGGSSSALNQASSSFFIPNAQQNSNIAIAVTFPVFQGGLIQSQTRQSQYNFQTATEQMEKVYRDVVVNSSISFNTITDGISKIKADRATVLSQQNTVQSTEAQFLVGTRTMVDVVNAQQHLFEAQVQLAQDQYGYMNSILNLKYLAGTLSVSDLEELNNWLASTRVNTPPRHASKTKPSNHRST